MRGRTSKSNRLKSGEKAARLGILVSLFLSLLKLIVGYISNSIVLISDGIHSGADSITSFASWIGLRLAQKKPTERFPYGYYKAENLATLVVSLFIFYAAVTLMIDGYEKLFLLPSLIRPFEALGVALLSSVASLLLSRHMMAIGKNVGSQSLIANAKERRVDVLASSLVFVAILMTFFNIPYVEGVATIVISLLALKTGFDIAKGSVFALMDVSPSGETEEKIREVLGSNKGIETYQGLRLRKSGPLVFGEVKIKIRKDVDVKRAHDISDVIEKAVMEKVDDLESFTIHVEPYRSKKEKIVIPVKNKSGMGSKVMENFGRANYFAFVTLDTKNRKSESVYFKKNPYKNTPLRAGFKSAEFVVEDRADVVVTHQVGGISFHTLRDNLIDVCKVEGKTLSRVVKNYLDGKFERLDEPTKELGTLSKKEKMIEK